MQATIVDIIWDNCKACLTTQNEPAFRSLISSLHRYLDVPLNGSIIYSKYLEVIQSLNLNSSLKSTRKHNAFSRTLVLLLAGYQLHWESDKGGFTNKDIYRVVEEILGGKYSLWSGKPSNNFETNVRSAVLEHCSSSAQYWFRHNNFINKRCVDIFHNESIFYQNQSRGWMKGNYGKSRRMASYFTFNHTLEPPSYETVQMMHNVSLDRNTPKIVHRTDGGSKHNWSIESSKILIYPQACTSPIYTTGNKRKRNVNKVPGN